MNAASLSNKRLQAILGMTTGRWATSLEIASATGSIAPSTDVAALRCRLRPLGGHVMSSYVGKSVTGARVYAYRSIMPPEPQCQPT